MHAKAAFQVCPILQHFVDTFVVFPFRRLILRALMWHRVKKLLTNTTAYRAAGRSRHPKRRNYFHDFVRHLIISRTHSLVSSSSINEGRPQSGTDNVAGKQSIDKIDDFFACKAHASTLNLMQ